MFLRSFVLSVPVGCRFPKLRSAFDAMRLRVPFATETREDLHEMQQVISNGNYNYKAPRTDAGHSDRCTALALCIRAASAGGEYIKPWTCGGGSRSQERRTI